MLEPKCAQRTIPFSVNSLKCINKFISAVTTYVCGTHYTCT